MTTRVMTKNTYNEDDDNDYNNNIYIINNEENQGVGDIQMFIQQNFSLLKTPFSKMWQNICDFGSCSYVFGTNNVFFNLLMPFFLF